MLLYIFKHNVLFMGIPSYFSHVVRRHPQIISRLTKNSSNKKCEGIINIDNLYLDSNSIIYDAIRTLENQDSCDFEERLINAVCEKIAFYIRKIGATQRVFIAFDGVAPMAKLNQQRTRRYKSWYQARLKEEVLRGLVTGHPTTPDNNNNINNNKGLAPSNGGLTGASTYNTSAITPGTQFMEKLSKAIHLQYGSPNACKTFGIKSIIISTSSEAGEGEHKIFEYIRANPDYHKDTITVIYGLDADLIMLSLNHLHLCKQLYLHRETPEFIKNIDSSLDHESDYLFCINTLNSAVEMECFDNTTPLSGTSVPKLSGVVGGVITSAPLTYVFMCFLLGNDFLPHFPSLNIRTNGLDKIMNAYKLIKSPAFFVLDTSKGIVFNWKNIRSWIDVLAKQEHENIKEEYVLRSKLKYNHMNNKDDTLEQKFDKIILQYPLREREVEEYINPNEAGWEQRYYRTLFDISIDDARRKEICMNYLEGLEWTMKYYTSGCPDWTWCYNYDYPPLLCDLIKYVPYFETKLINPANLPTYAVSPLVQLSYVLPRSSMYLLPDVLHRVLLKEHPEWYGTTSYAEYPLVWAFTRYIWESHVKLPEINIKELTKTVENCVMVK
jgi:5'-3' exoribonuclease 2